jgi:ABC-type phosphate transport system substrate-binding protein
MKTLFRTLTLTLLCATPLARADFVVVTHPDSPVTALTSDQVRAIFNGNIKAFPSSSIIVNVLDQPMRAEVYREFYATVFKLTPEKVKRRRAAYLFSGQGMIPETLPDDAGVLEKVATDSAAIGYVDSAKLSGNVKVVYRFP